MSNQPTVADLEQALANLRQFCLHLADTNKACIPELVRRIDNELLARLIESAPAIISTARGGWQGER